MTNTTHSARMANQHSASGMTRARLSMMLTLTRPITSYSVVGCGKNTFVFLTNSARQTVTNTTTQSYNIMLNQILSAGKQLKRLLKTKDLYHADLVETLLAKIDKAIPSDNPQGVDKDVIIKALKDKADS